MRLPDAPAHFLTSAPASDNQVLAGRAGAIEALLPLLSGGCGDAVKEWVAGALCNITANAGTWL